MGTFGVRHPICSIFIAENVSYKPGRNQSAEIDLEMTQMIE
jgi:hypothetical protein